MTRPTKVAFVSLGCAKNLVDSEKMLGQLAEAGCALTNDERHADVVVINTCGFLEASRAEALAEIAEAVRHKRRGKVKRVVVAGCLVQRDKDALLEAVEGIDALVGVNNRDDIVPAVLGRTNGRRPQEPKAAQAAAAARKGAASLPVLPAAGRGSSRARLRSTPDLYLSDYHAFTQLDTGRLRLTPRHYAYLRISEGCDQKCTFCTIPSIRGPMHSKPPHVIVAEARELVADGAVELSLIGQDTTSYGQDLGDTAGLAGLLRELDRIEGLGWIRLMYVYPSVLTDEMIDAIAECRKVVKYIDIPLQHIHDRVLKSMHRRITRAQTETLLDKLRQRIAGVTIRTTLIAGFPGETDEEFEALVDFVRDFRFDALGVFAYSREPETPAGRMKDQMPEEVKRARVDRLMTVQQEVAFALAGQRVGSRFEVLVDGHDGQGRTIARHAGQAPGVDSVTLVKGPRAPSGSFMEVRCDGRDKYDLTAVPTRTPLTVL